MTNNHINITFRDWLEIVGGLGFKVVLVPWRERDDEKLPPLAFACCGEACTGEPDDTTEEKR